MTDMVCIACGEPVEPSDNWLWVHSHNKYPRCFAGEADVPSWAKLFAEPTCAGEHAWVDTGKRSKYFPSASTVKICSVCGLDQITIDPETEQSDD